MPIVPESNPDANAFDALKVLELINLDAEPQRITCVCQWDDAEGNEVRCERDIDGDRQVKAWKELLDLPWGSEDSCTWRAALGDAAKLLSCGRHASSIDIESVTMMWAAQAKLHTYKARGDRLLLGYGEPASSRVIEGIRAPKPRRATTASRPRVLMSTGRTRSTYIRLGKASHPRPDNSEQEKTHRKDSALGSSTSRSDAPQAKRYAYVEPAEGEPAMFQLDEEVKNLKDALWKDLQECADESQGILKRVRSCSDPEVHMNEVQLFSGNIRAKSMSTITSLRLSEQSGCAEEADICRKPRMEELLYTQRAKLDAAALEEMLERDHTAEPEGEFFRDRRQQKWTRDKQLREETCAGELHPQLSAEELERQSRRQRERLEDEIRSRIEDVPDQNDFAAYGASEADPNEVQSSWAAYMHGWFRVLQLDAFCSGEELYAALPRPVLGHGLRAKYQQELTADFERDVSDFYRNMPGGRAPDRTEFRRKLKAEVARFHPDKILQRFPVVGGSEEVVSLVTRVTQVITLLIARA